MTDGFTVDPGQLAARAHQLEGLASRAGTIHRQLADALAETGNCWGTDSIGESFAATHATAADDTLTRLGSLSEQLNSIGVRFADSANAYVDADSDAATRLEGSGDG